MNPRTAMAIALMMGTAADGQQLAGLLESYGHTVAGRKNIKARRAKSVDPERQAAAEAKRQRRIERNRKLEARHD